MYNTIIKINCEENIMNIVLIVVLALIAILIVAIICWIIATYNKFVKMRNNVDEGFSTMDVYLKKRYDLIPNLVATVKGYAKHEAEALEKTIAARNMAHASGDITKQLQAEGAISGALKSLFAVTENYPELKANHNFLDLQNQLKVLEDDIASSRKYYNGVVKIYNTKREVFPSNIIANWFKFEKRPLYEVSAPEERENVKVEF